MSDYSEQEISLRPYIEAVLSKWYWILGLGFLAGILAYGASILLLTPTYEATALVAVVEPRQRVQFDPRIVTVEENQPLRAYPEIAVSDELLATFQNESAVAASFTLQHLRSMLKASPGNDPSLLKLSARNEDPEVASEIVNGWAELFVSWANKTYGDSSEDQLLFFEQRLEAAAEELKASEDELVEYQAENRLLILENELQALQRTHANLLAKEGEIKLLSRDIESILATSQDDLTRDSLATDDEFTAIIFKLRAFGGAISGENVTSPYQLLLNTDTVSTENGNSTEEQVLNLQAVLEVQAEQTIAALAEIEPQILSVQKEIQAANATESLMQRSIDLAEETHTALARTVEEKRITTQDTSAGVNLASRSSVPASPIGPRKSFNALAASVGVMFLVTFIIILITWWRSE